MILVCFIWLGRETISAIQEQMLDTRRARSMAWYGGESAFVSSRRTNELRREVAAMVLECRRSRVQGGQLASVI